MTVEEFTLVLSPLAVALRAEVDEPTFRTYHRAFPDLTIPWLQAIVETALQSDRQFFPTVPELRQLALKCRQALEVAHPWDGCADCDMQKGWRTVLIDGSTRVERCPCKARHTERIARHLREGPIPLGLPPSPSMAKEPKELTEATMDPVVLKGLLDVVREKTMPHTKVQTDPEGQPL